MSALLALTPPPRAPRLESNGRHGESGGEAHSQRPASTQSDLTVKNLAYERPVQAGRQTQGYEDMWNVLLSAGWVCNLIAG